MLTLLFSIIDREEYVEHEQYFSLAVWNMEDSTRDSLRLYNQWVTEQTITLCFQWYLTFYRVFYSWKYFKNLQLLSLS